MADHSLAHPDTHLYQIQLKDLEAVHHKINQALAQLSMLSDWVTESNACTLSLHQKSMVDGVLCSLIFLLETTLKFLPEL